MILSICCWSSSVHTWTDEENIVGFLDRYGVQPMLSDLPCGIINDNGIWFFEGDLAPFFDGPKEHCRLSWSIRSASSYSEDHIRSWGYISPILSFTKQNIASFRKKIHIGPGGCPILRRTAYSLFGWHGRLCSLALPIKIRKRRRCWFWEVCWGKRYFAPSVHTATGGLHWGEKEFICLSWPCQLCIHSVPPIVYPRVPLTYPKYWLIGFAVQFFLRLILHLATISGPVLCEIVCERHVIYSVCRHLVTQDRIRNLLLYMGEIVG